MTSLPFNLDKAFPGGTPFAYRAYSKAGGIFALIPDNRKAHRTFVPKLPAHSTKARWMRKGLQWWTQLPLPRIAGRRIEIPLNDSHPFISFGHRVSGLSEDTEMLPVFLPGNPKGTAPRLVVLWPDKEGKPAAVIKAGFNGDAKAAITRETAILRDAPETVQSVMPRFKGHYRDDVMEAFAMEYVEGSPPGWEHYPEMVRLLRSWVEVSDALPLQSIPAWQRLTQHPGSQDVAGILSDLGSKFVPRTVVHGDFAPWNILLETTGQFKVIDWETADRVGIPGWDLFHYWVQSAMLIDGLEGENLERRIMQSLEDSSVNHYFKELGLVGLTEPLLNAYLIYNYHFLNPVDKLDRPRANAASALDRLRLYAG